MSTTDEIAELVRQDYKNLGWTKENGFDISVIKSSFAGSPSIDVIDVRVKAMPFNPYSVDYIEWDKTNGANGVYEPFSYSKEKYTAEGKVFMEMLESVIESYNYTDRDAQQDYYNTNFYASVELIWDLEKEFLS